VGLGGLEPPPSSLSGIEGRAPCYSAYSQAMRLRRHYRDGVNYGLTWATNFTVLMKAMPLWFSMILNAGVAVSVCTKTWWTVRTAFWSFRCGRTTPRGHAPLVGESDDRKVVVGRRERAELLAATS
jgi:hypothetical protein